MFNVEPAQTALSARNPNTSPPALSAVTAESGDQTTQGGVISIDSTSVRRDGVPWFPVMGEYHFSRDDPSRWLHELRKMKAGGVNIVATYLVWIIHEEQRGQRRWDSHCDVRRFVEAAHEAGLLVMLRVGPWAHGEARNGGFPDWLQALPIGHRTNDPAYLDVVDDWYRNVAAQLEGLFRDSRHSGAPIVGIQVDNELYDQPEHLAKLREMAENAGMSAPLWVATGWGGAQVPLDLLIPVYAGYSDGFWEEPDIDWPPYAPMHFKFSEVRDDLSVGADLRGDSLAIGVDDRRYPFITCELGGGMAVAYHRRPRVDPEDVSALALTKIGSGSAWQGFYMYHGGTHVTGQLSGTQESHDTGYPNDVPLKDYDFYAPIGLAGTLRPHYHLLRRQHLFLREWGGELTQLPLAAAGNGGLRWVVRANEREGYLFVNNHQPAVRPLPAWDGQQFDVELDGGTVLLPSSPVRIPAGSHFFWPLRQHYGDVQALTGTVQPVTRVNTEKGLLVVFSETAGVDVELDIVSDDEISGARRISTAAGTRWIPQSRPGRDCIVTVGSTRLLILDEKTANTVWADVVDGRETVILWDGGLVFRGPDLLIERWGEATELHSFPSMEGSIDSDGPFSTLVLPPCASATQLVVSEIQQSSGLPETRRGGSAGRLSAPRDEDFAAAAVYEIVVPLDNGDASSVLSLDWHGDVARAYIGDTMVADQFWYGRPWELDVSVWRDQLDLFPLRIEILPWNGDAEFFLDARVRSQRVEGRAAIDSARLKSAERVPVAPGYPAT